MSPLTAAKRRTRMPEPVEVTVAFEPPATAEDMRDRFQQLADQMAELADE